MKQNHSLVLLCIGLIVLSSSCGGGKTKQSVHAGEALEMRYAQRLSIEDCGNYTKVEVQNPWDTAKILQTYLLVDREQALPGDLPKGVVVRTPLTKSVIYSAVHCSLMDELGVFNAIAGVCDLNYINLDKVQQAAREGKLLNLGDGLAPDIERMIDLMPDAILLSPFENSGGHGRVEQLGVPIIECADYMETSPLGRAEWMRFYGRLYGVGERADSLFATIEKSYLELKALAAKVDHRPTVISELKSGSAWYVPGGQSWISVFYRDAGAEYLFKEDSHSGSVPLSFETVFDKGQFADFWLIKYNQSIDKTYAELQREYAPYAGFKAFKTRAIYGCNTNTVGYYEEVPYHPDLFLRDLIKIFHPSLLPTYNSRFFTNLAD